MTLAEYAREINGILEKYPESKDFEVIYSVDDEGNEYNKVVQSPVLTQVEDIKESRFLEIVGFYGEKGISPRDCNAVCIN